MKGLICLSLLAIFLVAFPAISEGQQQLTCATGLAPCSTNPPDAYMACIDKSFVQAVSSFLPERKPVDKSLINPNDWNSNIVFDFKNESDFSGKKLSSFRGYVNITLLWEGAGYRNQFGYFLFDYDNKGNPVIRKDKDGKLMQYKLFLDVSFPSTSDKGACLQSGVSVDIGPFFHGDNVGFVIWPNWYNSQSLKTLYSVAALNDKQEVHVFVFSLQGNYVLGIEDVILSSADRDYNDVVFQFQTTKGAIVDVPSLDPCPGDVPCNGHGICNATSKSCICTSSPTATYYGQNCENGYICNCEQGICVGDGICTCDPKFGADCKSCADGLYKYPECKECSKYCGDQKCNADGSCIPPPPPPNPTPACLTKPFGADASDYLVFTRSDFVGANSDVQGRIAAGGDISLSLYSLTESLNPNDDDNLKCSDINPSWAAVAAGDFSWDNGNARIGSLAVGGKNNIDQSVVDGLGVGCSVVPSSSVINFKDAFDYLLGVSDAFAAESPNGETFLEKKKSAILYLNAPSKQPDNYNFFFEVEGDQLAEANSVIFGNFNDKQVKLLVINVNTPSGKFGFKDTSFETILQGSSVNLGQKIVWNFKNANSLSIQAISLPGVILAPRANVKGSNGVVWGQIFANSFSGDLQINYPVGNEALCIMSDYKITKEDSACPPCSEGAEPGSNCKCICKRPCPEGKFADPFGSCDCVCPVDNNCALGVDPETCLCYGAQEPEIDSSVCYSSYEGSAWPSWMTDFQIVTRKDLSLKATRVGGRVAGGGQVTLKRIAVGDRLANNKNPDCAATNGQVVDAVVLANGPLFFKSGSVTGNIYAGSYTQLSEYLSFPLSVKQGLEGCNLPRTAAEKLAPGQAWNFDDAWEKLQTYSNTIANQILTPATGQTYFAYDVLTFWGYGQSIEVFRVSADDLAKARRIDLKGVKNTASIIIDVVGSDITIRDVGTVSLLPFARSLLWNAAQAKTFSFKNVALPGLIVAPKATIDNPVGRLLGGAFVDSFSAKGNIALEWPFKNWGGCLPKTESLVECSACPAGSRRLSPVLCECSPVVSIVQSAVTRFYGDSGALVTFKVQIAGERPPSALTLKFNTDSCSLQLNQDTNEPNVFSLVKTKSDESGITYVTPNYAGFTAASFSFVVVFENEAGDCTTIPTPSIVNVSYDPITADD